MSVWFDFDERLFNETRAAVERTVDTLADNMLVAIVDIGTDRPFLKTMYKKGAR